MHLLQYPANSDDYNYIRDSSLIVRMCTFCKHFKAINVLATIMKETTMTVKTAITFEPDVTVESVNTESDSRDN